MVFIIWYIYLIFDGDENKLICFGIWFGDVISFCFSEFVRLSMVFVNNVILEVNIG